MPRINTRSSLEGLHRTENDQWGMVAFEEGQSPFRRSTSNRRLFGEKEAEVQPSLPGDDVPSDAVRDLRICTKSAKVARLAAYVLGEKGVSSLGLGKTEGSVEFAVEGDHNLAGRWKIAVQPFKPGLMNAVKQYLPFTKMLQRHDVTVLSVEQLEGPLKKTASFISGLFKSAPAFSIEVPESLLDVDPPHLSNYRVPEEHFKTVPQQDSYSELAAYAFQYLESQFHHTKEIRGDYQFVQDGKGGLTLKPRKEVVAELDKLTGKDKVEARKAMIEANQQIVRDYLRFVEREFGSWYVKDTENRFKFHIRQMITNGEPLCPEHVYRMNIGAHEVDQGHIERLIHKINRFLDCDESIEGMKLEEFLIGENELREHGRFSFRELRVMAGWIDGFDYQHATMRDFKAAIQEKLGASLPKKLQNCTPHQVKHLVEILEPHSSGGVYTGRAVTDCAIMGYYTKAETKHFKPWLDLQEMLQVWPNLRSAKSDAEYCELLSHIVSKKHCIMQDRDKGWRTGRIFPARDSSTGEPRYYVVTSLTDDDKGDFNYTLEPAAKYDEPLAAVKLYRSTASDTYAISGNRSVEADLSLPGPGAANREAGDEYELQFIHSATIPLWVGYMEHARNTVQERGADLEKAETLLKKAWHELSLSDKTFTKPWHAISTKSPPSKYKQALSRRASELRSIARKKGELPELKKDNDLFFVGHSLGGSLAQGGLYHFLVEDRRIPLPGHTVSCYGSDSPGMGYHENDNFIHFGRAHSELFKDLGIKWNVDLSFEYGDPVPLGGDAHLGAHDFKTGMEWLHTRFRVFKPLETAQALEITTTPTHGRRMGGATEGRDYKVTHLTPEQMQQFDESWNPFGKDRTMMTKTFGYRLVHSKWIAEKVRQGVAAFRGPIAEHLHKVKKAIAPDRVDYMRNSKGHLHIRVRESHFLGNL